MNHQFDELTKGMAQSFTRRAALKKFAGLAGMALACLGLANRAKAGLTDCAKCIRRCRHQHPTWTDYQCQTACFSSCV
jgi:hypothetical protein